MTPGLKLGNLKRVNDAHWIVIGILVISLLLRWMLIFRGGQYYISDETRYEVSRDAARLLWQGQAGQAFQQFTISPEHLGFKVIGILPALAEHWVGPNLILPALFYSLFSLLNLYLIFLLSQRATGVASREALLTLILAACCLSLLYYARHLFPYDMAMSFGLWALYVALAEPQTIKTSLACGVLGFLCFITYNGYWPLAGFAMLINVLIGGKSVVLMIRKAIATAIGFLAPLGLLILGMSLSGTDMIAAYRLFATSITQGSFEEGWSLPFAYFWYVEHAVIVILGALALLAVIRGGWKRYTGLWLAGLVIIYLCLLIPSVFLHSFVVYGRLARQMIPFLVLLSAEGLAQIESRFTRGKKMTSLILAAVLVQAGWNFGISYNLSYPRDFAAEAQVRFPGFEFSSKRLAFGAPVICENHGYIMENAKYYVDPPEMVPQVPGQLLMSALHPSTFRPYQYDGDPPATRKAFDRLQLKMAFYKVDEQILVEMSSKAEIKNCMIREK